MTDSETDGTVRVEFQVPALLLRLLKLVSGHDIGVNVPTSSTPANVQTSVGGTTGSICATGNNAIGASYIYAKVYPGTVNVPLKPPPMTQFTVPDVNGLWSFASIPGAQCNSSGSAPNTLALWTDWGATVPNYNVQSIAFTGLASSFTDCTGSGSASPSGSASGSPPGPPHDGVETAPRQWQAVAAGFTKPCEVFNDIWLLTVVGGGHSTWDNGSDGKAAPQVELMHDRAAKVWQLTFRYKKYVVHYEKPAGEWRRLNANIFTKVTASKELRGAVPEYVTVVPV